MVWLCSAIGMVLSTCCVCMGAATRIVPKDEWMRQLPPDMPNHDMVIRMLPTFMVVMAIMGVVLMLVPAIALVVLGFKVKKGNRGGTIAAMILLWIQVAAFAMILLISLPGLVTAPSLPGMGMVLVLAGCVLIFGGTIIMLFKSLKEVGNESVYVNRAEPWNL
jgi:hypothetical protein